MWVPVTVEEDDGVGGLQVEPQTPSPRAEHEDEVLAVVLVEGLQQQPSIVSLGGAVQTQVLEA